MLSCPSAILSESCSSLMYFPSAFWTSAPKLGKVCTGKCFRVKRAALLSRSSLLKGIS
uniref:Uncharacterized protein n=1 Tax=Timema shepardi TaxID=629360 RepID=A0A7R9B7X6_TIMSH|nr:unnamed protein product [Timema shepardi]